MRVPRVGQTNTFIRSEISSIALYQIIHSPENLLISAVPYCIKTKEQETDSYAKYVEKIGIIGFRKERIETILTGENQLRLDLKTDENFKLQKSANIKIKYSVEYNLKMTKKDDNWLGALTDISSSYIYRRPKTDLALKNCSLEDLENGNINLVKTKENTLISLEEYGKVQEREKKNKVQCEF